LRFIHFHFCFIDGFEADCRETWWQTAHRRIGSHLNY
jgi:hypothetical protein